ncbi:DUF1365 domain-containing protein [Salinimonas chungwhensis]|uniref:DUF1365 domain-containing protein n=1 Tax=Salinimonas chungwhensis TaxID=265425 RepID=UPI00037E5776|nr:DUF1365 domain-containing protein [Salinimonas chungwhensis]
MTSSGIYHGTVYHERFLPTRHRFTYSIFLFWISLDELNQLDENVKHFSSMHRSLVRFRRTDYVGDESQDVKLSVLSKITELGGPELNGDVFLLGQLRMFGLYFSPVNFYFVRPAGNTDFSHMLAEVSNTPWNERHYYLVNLAEQRDTEKQFHVSPFNPMDMQYKWQIEQPGDAFTLRMDCYQDKKHFSAGLAMKYEPLTSKTLRKALLKTPSMTVKTVVGIYWQALKLWLKRTPVYSHPNS